MKQTIMLVVYVARCILSSYKRPICNPVSDAAYFDDLTIVSVDTCISVTVLYNCSGPQWHLAECCTTMYVAVVVLVMASSLSSMSACLQPYSHSHSPHSIQYGATNATVVRRRRPLCAYQ